MESLICFSTAQEEFCVFCMQQFATSRASGKCFDNFPCLQWKRVCFLGDFRFVSNQKNSLIVWFQFLGGFPASIGYQNTNYIYAQFITALVVYDFLTCTLFSATAAYAYVFKEIWILSNLGRWKKPSFFGGGLFCFVFSSERS